MKMIYKRLQEVRKREEGFTLIELLIVILVLGILAGIAVFASGPFRERASAACQDANTEIGIIHDAAVDAGVSGDLYTQQPGNCDGTDIAGGGGPTTTIPGGGAAPVMDSVTLSFPGGNVDDGETVTATVATSGGAGTVSYQWQNKNDGLGNSCAGGGWNNVGSNSATYTTPGGAGPFFGDYCLQVVATVTNGAGSDSASAVTLVD